MLIGFAATSHAAAIDCARAKSVVEIAVCTQPELAALDDALNASFQEALARTRARATLIAEQKAWLIHVRDACRDATCLATVYAARIKVLGRGTPPPTPSATAVANGKLYAVFRAPHVAWPVAALRCAAWGGGLAGIPDAATNDAVAKLMAGYSEGWLALSAHRGQWRWRDRAVQFAHWRAGEPSGDGVHGAIWGTANEAGTPGTWNDEGNLADIDAYVCERPERPGP